jgi:hypothetical protein
LPDAAAAAAASAVYDGNNIDFGAGSFIMLLMKTEKPSSNDGNVIGKLITHAMAMETCTEKCEKKTAAGSFFFMGYKIAVGTAAAAVVLQQSLVLLAMA